MNTIFTKKPIPMKNLILALFAVILSASSFAQVDELDSKWLRYMVESERRTVFLEAMDLKGAADSTFWVLFNEYEKELDKIREEYIKDLYEYSKKYDHMSGDDADNYINRHFAQESQRIAVQKKYHKKIAKAVDQKTAARFVQVDDAVHMIMRLNVMDEFPFIGDFN